MKLFIFYFFLLNALVDANVLEYVSISKIHITSNDNDSIVFDLDFGGKRADLSSSFRAFGIYYSLKPQELSYFKKVPVINYCVLEKERGLISKEDLSKIKKCLEDDTKCEDKVKKEKLIKKLYIRCGRGNQESIYLIFDNRGKLDIKVTK